MDFENCYFLIPARKGSKGFPLKNRKLFEYTIDTIPEEFKSKTYVSTDDEYIKELAKERKINIIDRPKELAQDKTSMKQVLSHFIKIENITCNDDIILLYLTYPERTWKAIKDIYSRYVAIKEKSLVCCEEVEEHPYLCFHEKENNKAKTINYSSKEKTKNKNRLLNSLKEYNLIKNKHIPEVYKINDRKTRLETLDHYVRSILNKFDPDDDIEVDIQEFDGKKIVNVKILDRVLN